jgi:hypothetical protein
MKEKSRIRFPSRDDTPGKALDYATDDVDAVLGANLTAHVTHAQPDVAAQTLKRYLVDHTK